MSSRQVLIDGMCYVIPLAVLRQTPSVDFHSIPVLLEEGLAAVDRVQHQAGAQSPSLKDQPELRPWYMHPDQEDNLMVFDGKRIVDLYTVEHGKIESFEVTKEGVKHNGVMLYEGPHLFGWYHHVFHRVQSPNGSLSLNFARHFEGFDIMTNFNIYTVDEASGEYEVVREGHLDQPKMELGE